MKDIEGKHVPFQRYVITPEEKEEIKNDKQLPSYSRAFVQDARRSKVCPGSILLAIVAKEIIEKKLCQKITYKYRKNRRNNKSNKNQDLGKKEAKKGPEMSANIAKIANITRIFLAS